jgi:hypothetical protein
VPVEDVDELHERLCKVWCDRVDAEPQAQFAGPVSDGGGLVRYIALHFLKPSQAPPIGWRGHRISYTGGYLVRPASMMRRQARESLRLKRELWRAVEAGAVGHDAELQAQEAVKLAAASVWALATDRGARVSATTYDRRRLILQAATPAPPATTSWRGPP